MLCPECGMLNEEGSLYCSNCGARLALEKKEKKKGKGKIIAAIAVAAIVVVALLVGLSFLNYETDKANELVEKANREIELGNDLLNNGVSPKLAEFEEIDLDLESESEINAALSDVSRWRQDALSLTPTIGTVKDHFEKAKSYFEETKALRLPEWYHDYIDLKIKALEKDLERISKIEELVTNYVLYYGFAESYLRGELMLSDVLDDLDEGNSYLNDGNYSAAADSFRSALSGLRDSQEEFSAAGEIIDLGYMEDMEDYLERLDSVLEALMQATEFLNLGSLFQANSFLNSANMELGLLGESPESLVGGELSSWYDLYIDGLISDIEDLVEEVNELEEEAQELYEENA